MKQLRFSAEFHIVGIDGMGFCTRAHNADAQSVPGGGVHAISFMEHNLDGVQRPAK